MYAMIILKYLFKAIETLAQQPEHLCSAGYLNAMIWRNHETVYCIPVVMKYWTLCLWIQTLLSFYFPVF
jgi:hypothetical protein